MALSRAAVAAWSSARAAPDGDGALRPTAAVAQGTRDDYARPDALRGRTSDKVFKARVEPHWDAGGARFWYRNDLAGGAREFVAVDAAKGSRRPAFDHDALAKA